MLDLFRTCSRTRVGLFCSELVEFTEDVLSNSKILLVDNNSSENGCHLFVSRFFFVKSDKTLVLWNRFPAPDNFFLYHFCLGCFLNNYNG